MNNSEVGQKWGILSHAASNLHQEASSLESWSGGVSEQTFAEPQVSCS